MPKPKNPKTTAHSAATQRVALPPFITIDWRKQLKVIPTPVRGTLEFTIARAFTQEFSSLSSDAQLKLRNASPRGLTIRINKDFRDLSSLIGTRSSTVDDQMRRSLSLLVSGTPTDPEVTGDLLGLDLLTEEDCATIDTVEKRIAGQRTSSGPVDELATLALPSDSRAAFSQQATIDAKIKDFAEHASPESVASILSLPVKRLLAAIEKGLIHGYSLADGQLVVNIPECRTVLGTSRSSADGKHRLRKEDSPSSDKREGTTESSEFVAATASVMSLHITTPQQAAVLTTMESLVATLQHEIPNAIERREHLVRSVNSALLRLGAAISRVEHGTVQYSRRLLLDYHSESIVFAPTDSSSSWRDFASGALRIVANPNIGGLVEPEIVTSTFLVEEIRLAVQSRPHNTRLFADRMNTLLQELSVASVRQNGTAVCFHLKGGSVSRKLVTHGVGRSLRFRLTNGLTESIATPFTIDAYKHGHSSH